MGENSCEAALVLKAKISIWYSHLFTCKTFLSFFFLMSTLVFI